MKILFLFPLMVLGAVLAVDIGTPHYHVAVKGALFCGSDPYGGAQIQLYDYDYLYPDVKLSDAKSLDNGKFHIEGDRFAWVPMVPYFLIQDKCNGNATCSKFWVPVDYQWTDGNPKKIYHIGHVNLSEPTGLPC